MIPESPEVLHASNQGIPVTHLADALASQAYMDAVERFLGNEVPLRHVTAERPGLLKRLFGTR